MLRTSLSFVLGISAALPASAQYPGNDFYGNTSSATALALSTGYNFIPDLAIVGIDGGDYTVPDDGQDLFSLTLAAGGSVRAAVPSQYRGLPGGNGPQRPGDLVLLHQLRQCA